VLCTGDKLLPSLFNWMIVLRWPHVEGIEEESNSHGEQSGSTGTEHTSTRIGKLRYSDGDGQNIAPGGGEGFVQ
jgi:hypothetical protein